MEDTLHVDGIFHAFALKPCSVFAGCGLIGTCGALPVTVKNIVMDKKDPSKQSAYGNFDLEDETGSVYVYGLTVAPVAKNDQSFPKLEIKEGDVITIVGTRAVFDETGQVGGPAYFIKKHESVILTETFNESLGDFTIENKTTLEEGKYVWAHGTYDDADWATVTMPTLPGGASFNYVNSGEIDLASFVGAKIKIAFKYVSTEDVQPTWQIRNITIK